MLDVRPCKIRWLERTRFTRLVFGRKDTEVGHDELCPHKIHGHNSHFFTKTLRVMSSCLIMTALSAFVLRYCVYVYV